MVINQKFILHSILNKRSMIPFPPSSTISASLGKPFVAKTTTEIMKSKSVAFSVGQCFDFAYSAMGR